MAKNKRLGSDYGDVPMPRGQKVQGSEDFTVNRMIDGHVPGEVGNQHHPNSDDVMDTPLDRYEDA